MSVTTVPVLSPAQLVEVSTLLASATAADGVAPLSEQFRLGLRPGSGRTHLLAYAGTQLAGYAQVDGAAAELVVAPSQRRHGVGTRLLGSLPDGVRVWAHGCVPAAEEFARATGLVATRELLLLGRHLADGSLPEPVLPGGLRVRAFEPGRDEEEWLRANAAAFRHHPEQGRVTRSDLDARTAEPWFDPAGFLLVVPEDDEDRVAAFHWTKVHPALGAAAGGIHGEVYVVGVDPAYQGRGLGRPVTLLGLHHLRERAVSDVTLYTDADNAPALRVYRSLGFTARGRDRMYSRAADVTVGR